MSGEGVPSLPKLEISNEEGFIHSSAQKYSGILGSDIVITQNELLSPTFTSPGVTPRAEDLMQLKDSNQPFGGSVWNNSVELSSRVENVISQMFPSSDPLDLPDFDPIAYLNAHFPTEASLSKLDEFSKQTNARIKKLDEEIRLALREASSEEDAVKKGMEHAENSVRDLATKVMAVKQKADESEKMVQELCAEVKHLDCAKRNLTSTFTALKRLHMLTSAVDQLQEMAKNQQYNASNLLEAIDDLFIHFRDFMDIKKISDLQARVTQYKKMLLESILDKFRYLGASPEGVSPDILKNLKNACEVIDVLGPDAVKRLVSWVCSKQLEAYVAIFEPISGTNYRDGTAQAGLNNVERRFAWLRRQLQKFVTIFGTVFLKEWNVPGKICIEFCMMTHQHLIRVLMDTKDQGALDVQLLVKMLQRTISFEEELERYYSKASAIQMYYDEDPDKFDDPLDQSSSYEVVRRKLKDQKLEREKERREAEYLKEQELEESMRRRKPNADQQKLLFKGIISKAFASFMNQYVDMEKSNIIALIEKIGKEESWYTNEPASSDRKEESRLASSDNLFMYIQKSSKRCSKLDSRKLFFDIIQEYRKALSLYCDLMRSKVPKVETPTSIRSGDIKLICRIVNTCEYCVETIPAMKENLIQMIDPIYAEKVDFESETEAFQVLINQAIDPIVLFILFNLDIALSNMEKMNWSIDSVGDSSPYVGEVRILLSNHLSPIAESISSEYHSYLCRKIAESFIPRYLASICKCKKINEPGAQQLLLDAQDLENLLERMPKIGLDPKTSRKAPALYLKFVKKEMGKAVVILKTIACPPSTTGETFRTLMRNGNFADLARLMDLKGMKKTEQQPIIEAYNKKVPPTQQMAPFLREDPNSNVVDPTKIAERLIRIGSMLGEKNW